MFIARKFEITTYIAQKDLRFLSQEMWDFKREKRPQSDTIGFVMTNNQTS